MSWNLEKRLGLGFMLAKRLTRVLAEIGWAYHGCVAAVE